MAELADALDLGSSGATREGSSPFLPTQKNRALLGLLHRLGVRLELLVTVLVGILIRAEFANARLRDP